MEYLYQINPILLKDVVVIIYGTGEAEKSIFYALLQQNVYVKAFCEKKGQDSSMREFFNKKIIALQELEEKYKDAYVIVTGQNAIEDSEVLREMDGICNVIIENITSKDKGILFVGE